MLLALLAVCGLAVPLDAGAPSRGVEPAVAAANEEEADLELDPLSLADRMALEAMPTYAELECYVECMQYCLWWSMPETGAPKP